MPFKKTLSLLTVLVICCYSVGAQSVFVPLNQDYSHLVDRYEIMSGRLSNDFHSNVKPYRRADVVKLTEALEADSSLALSTVDHWNVNYLQNDSWEWLKPEDASQSDNEKPILKYIYRKKSDFLQESHEDFEIHASPVVYFGQGVESVGNGGQNNLYVNTRGVEIRGILNQKLGFYTYFSDNQVIQPDHVKDFIRLHKGFPYEGYTKVVDNDSTRMLTDYFTARGYVVFRPLKSLQVQFGHDRNFIGSGIRSLILSDFSSPYLQLKTTVKVGKMQYMTIFGQMLNNQLSRPAVGNVPLPPKFISFHHLDVNILPNLNVGLFETVMFGKRQIGFDPNYINPVIFYRFVEGILGSSDNVIVGADVKYNFLNSFSAYGQFVLDEFNQKKQQQEAGWWGKKIGGQLGLKYVNVAGVDNLDLQLEYNVARPYLYSHFSTYSNLVNNNVPLAHPLGANFKELLFVGRYQPIPRLSIHLTYMMAQAGEDIGGVNYGGNVLRLNTDRRVGEFGNFILQGRKTNINMLDAAASYMVFHNLFLEVQSTYRVYSSAENTLNKNAFSATGAIRWNIGRMPKLF